MDKKEQQIKENKEIEKILRTSVEFSIMGGYAEHQVIARLFDLTIEYIAKMVTKEKEDEIINTFTRRFKKAVEKNKDKNANL